MKGAQERQQGAKGSHEEAERFMSLETVFKTIELTAESNTSWEAAAQQCIQEAAATVKNIRELKVESMKALVDQDQIVRYRLRCRVAFAVDTSLREH
jgi:flavin-binding protein dodecin